MVRHQISMLDYILLSVCALLIIILALSAVLKLARLSKTKAGGRGARVPGMKSENHD
jgi:hypothetical protein